MQNPFREFGDEEVACIHAALAELLGSRAAHDWLFDPESAPARIEIDSDGRVKRGHGYGVPAGPDRNLLFRLGHMAFEELEARAAQRRYSLIEPDPQVFATWEHFCGALMEAFQQRRRTGRSFGETGAEAQPA